MKQNNVVVTGKIVDEEGHLLEMHLGRKLIALSFIILTRRACLAKLFLPFGEVSIIVQAIDVLETREKTI